MEEQNHGTTQALETPDPPSPNPAPLSLSLPLRWERGCVKIISTIVILFIRSGRFPDSYTEQIIVVSNGWVFSIMHVASEKA